MAVQGYKFYLKHIKNVEDITGPIGDTNFIFECWKYLCSFYRYWWNSYIKHNFFFIHFWNSKIVQLKWSPVTKMLWNSDIKL